MNILEGLIQSIQQPPTPIHAGEAFQIWTYFVEVSETRALLLLMANHSNDKDLKEIIEHMNDDLLEPQRQRLLEIMKNEGINAPQITADVGKADESLIPPGAKLTDAQMAQVLVVKIMGLLEWAHRGTVQSLRDDVGLMFNTFYNHMIPQAFTIKHTIQKRGWLRVPPYYHSGIPSPKQ